jgi:hypothetical protein
VTAHAHFTFRVDIWDDTGTSIVEHVASGDDFEVAEATYRAAVARWPAARPHLPASVCQRAISDYCRLPFRQALVIGTAFERVSALAALLPYACIERADAM